MYRPLSRLGRRIKAIRQLRLGSYSMAFDQTFSAKGTTFEVDHAITATVTTTTMTGSDTTSVVTATVLAQSDSQ